MRGFIIFIAIGMLSAADPASAQDAKSAGHADAGAIVFKKCMACHQVGEGARNGIGPVLNGIVGRRAGTYPGYNYSTATKNAGLVWDEPTLRRYLRTPRDVIRGTRMAFAGLTKDRDLFDVIAYLRQFDADGRQSRRHDSATSSAVLTRRSIGGNGEANEH
jgi:cytochrome c